MVVSHDRFFLDRVVTSILAFEEAGKVQLYAGNWDNYREQKREVEKAAKQVLRASQPPHASQPPTALAPSRAPPSPPSPPSPRPAPRPAPPKGDEARHVGRRKPTRKRGEG